MNEQHQPDEIINRREKTAEMKNNGILPYAERFEVNASPGEAAGLEEGTTGVSTAGRVVAVRYFGKLAFGHIFDHTGKVQFALQKNELGDSFGNFKRFVDVGDYIGITGDMFVTRTGETTVNVKEWTFLSKALRPLPEKFHGLADREQILRKRYLDLITNPESMHRFKTRTNVIKTIRNFLDGHDFIEIDTPVLTNKASGALATPFVTHYDALDMDVFLRIAPETYLKRAVAGGLSRVYEFARCFRNEGIDPSHLPDFTMLEYYAAYWNYRDNMDFTEKLVKHLLQEVNGSLTVTYRDQTISFDGSWPRKTFRELILADSGIDINKHTDKPSLVREITAKGIDLERDIKDDSIGFGTLVDLLYKKVSRPKIINPVFLTSHPIDISPLARRNDENPDITDRFQLVAKGWEIVNAYSELIDPIDQRERFEKQMEARAAGDTEAMEIDEDFLLTMEHGMPPMSGWGMGIDRIVALLTGVDNLRDVVLFPLLKPL
ncbi:MAG: lysine--tRNA ligase [Spirochaetia bacterium]